MSKLTLKKIEQRYNAWAENTNPSHSLELYEALANEVSDDIPFLLNVIRIRERALSMALAHLCGGKCYILGRPDYWIKLAEKEDKEIKEFYSWIKSCDEEDKEIKAHG